VPQAPQKRWSGSVAGVPQATQRSASSLPQTPQKRMPSGSSDPHVGQRVVIAENDASAAGARRENG
jgi:hypothetical protein